MKKKEIILGISASIAIYKSCDILRRLQEQGFNVSVVMTPDATQLISPQIFQSLSGNKVYSELFSQTNDYSLEHISLAEKPKLVLIAPATANIIGKIASGVCDNLLTSTVCATKAKVLIAPAMNTNMYKNRIVQDNIKKLKAYGYKFIEPRKGNLACGKAGVGCLAGVDEIVGAVKRYS